MTYRPDREEASVRTMTKLLVSATTGVVVASGLGTPAFAATPTVSSVTPTNGATSVPITVHPTVTFNAAVSPSSVRYSFVKTVGGTDVSGYYSYDAASRTLTLTPRAVLSYGTRYTVTIKLRSEEHTSELQSRQYLVCRLLLE